MTGEVSKTNEASAKEQRVQQHMQSQGARETEEYEASGNAEAKAGLNLNLVGAISGAFSGKGKKTTDTKADGSSHSVEDTKGHGTMAGSGAGTLNAVGEGKANTHEKYRKTVEADESESKSKGESKSKAVKQTDHLGLGE